MRDGADLRSLRLSSRVVFFFSFVAHRVSRCESHTARLIQADQIATNNDDVDSKIGEC